MNALDFFKSLKPEDWDKPVTEKWKVKDVLSHLVGWNKEVLRDFREVLKTGEEPWFATTEDYGEFNDKIFEEYKNESPEQLLSQMERWERELGEEIEKAGEAELRKRPDMEWLFDEGEDSHSAHHIAQVKKALEA